MREGEELGRHLFPAGCYFERSAVPAVSRCRAETSGGAGLSLPHQSRGARGGVPFGEERGSGARSCFGSVSSYDCTYLSS